MNVDNRRTQIIQEMRMGPVWKRRGSTDAGGALVEEAIAAPGNDKEIQASHAEEEVSLRVSSIPLEESRLDAVMRPSGAAPSADDVAGMDWIQLKENVAGCVKCRLCQTRTKTVFGVGDENADWLFVGEGPGRSEDAKGEPFVGPAGKLLDNMLLAMGLRRGENAYIANTVKCRPIGDDGRDRPPALDEAEACRPYLERQIALIQPKIVIALGKTAAISLLGMDPDTPVTKLRGQVHQYQGLPLVVTYHPAYLLRKLSEKGKVWSDLCLAMRTYGGLSR